MTTEDLAIAITLAGCCVFIAATIAIHRALSRISDALKEISRWVPRASRCELACTVEEPTRERRGA